MRSSSTWVNATIGGDTLSRLETRFIEIMKLAKPKELGPLMALLKGKKQTMPEPALFSKGYKQVNKTPDMYRGKLGGTI